MRSYDRVLGPQTSSGVLHPQGSVPGRMRNSILAETTLVPTSRRLRHGCNDLGTQGSRNATLPAAAAEATSSRVTTPGVCIRHGCRSSCRKSSGERQRRSAPARTLNSKNHDYITSLSNLVSTTRAAAVRKFTPATRPGRRCCRCTALCAILGVDIGLWRSR